jgi:hypothetical protein
VKFSCYCSCEQSSALDLAGLLKGLMMKKQTLNSNKGIFRSRRIGAYAGVLVAIMGIVLWLEPMAEAEATEIVVYKSPTCGCCRDWVEHLRDEGFKVTTHDRNDMQVVKSTYGVTPQLQSCHTAVVDGYVVEGHVPAGDIRRMLQERPKIAGLSAPGMPQKSPGMQPADDKPADYDVLSFDGNGKTIVYTRY